MMCGRNASGINVRRPAAYAVWPSVSLALALSIFGLAGCSSARHSATRHIAKPVSGVVDLDSMAQQSPDWMLVRQTDSALATYRAALATGIPSEQLPSMANVYAEPLSKLTVGPANSAAILNMAQRLSDASRVRSEALRSRLQAADARAYEDEKELAATDESLRISGRFRHLQSEGLQTEQVIADQDAAKRLELNMQIGALDRDRLGPVTAPQGHWDELLHARQRELNELDAQQASSLSIYRVTREGEYAKAKREEQATTVARLAAEKQSLETKTAAKLAEHANMLAQRRSDVIATAGSFDGDMVAALESARKEAPIPIGPRAAGNGPIGTVQSTQAWKARLAQTIEYLSMERDRQATLVREETRRSIQDIAQHNNLEIVGWQSSMGRHDLTAFVLAKLKGQGWR